MQEFGGIIKKIVGVRSIQCYSDISKSFALTCTFVRAALPQGKPRYVMGVGYPLDIVVCSALGADMYDRTLFVVPLEVEG
eukprot:1161604-Pelagomonas_calceolata.AAC.4